MLSAKITSKLRAIINVTGKRNMSDSNFFDKRHD